MFTSGSLMGSVQVSRCASRQGRGEAARFRLGFDTGSIPATVGFGGSHPSDVHH